MKQLKQLKHLLTRNQRLNLIEYLMAKNNGRYQQEFYNNLMGQWSSIVQMFLAHKGEGSVVTKDDLPELQNHVDHLVNAHVSEYGLYNDRDFLQIKLHVPECGYGLVVTPGNMLLAFKRGESEHDFCEYHKKPDIYLMDEALPYSVPDYNEPVCQQERDDCRAYLEERWQHMYQQTAFDALNNKIKKAAEQFRFELHSPELVQHLRRHVDTAFDEWVTEHRHILPAQHNFSVRVIVEDQVIIWYNSDFELLRVGKHPLNFVKLDRNEWKDQMLRSAAHDERVKEVRHDVQRP